MPSTERENNKEESSSPKKLIKNCEEEIKKEKTNILNLEARKEKEIKKEQKRLNSEFEKQIKKKEDYEQRIKKLEHDVLTLKEVKFKEKDTSELDKVKKEVEDNIQVLEKRNSEKKDKIVEAKEIKEQIALKLRSFINIKDELKNELKQMIDTTITNDNNFKLLINEKKLKIAKQRLENIDLSIKLQEKIREITELELDVSKNEQKIAVNKEWLIKENDDTYSNKKTKKELEIAELDVKLKNRICEIYGLELQLDNLCIKNEKISKEIISSDFTIIELEKSFIELKMKKYDLKHTKNKSREESRVILTTEDNVNQKKDKKIWFGGIFKPITNLIWGSKQKITLNYYQNRERKLTDEITKLEAEKLKNFWNKFWMVLSCGCYNNHGKVERKIEKRKIELEEVKKQKEKLTKINDLSSEPQPSTSSSIIQSEDWNIQTKVRMENEPLPKEKAKNLSINL